MARLRFLSSCVLALFLFNVFAGQAYAFPSAQKQSPTRLHVVSPDQLAGDLLRHHEARVATLNKIGELLQRPEVKRSLALLGADWTEVEGRVAALSAAELADIGSRIDAVSEQHPGGLHPAVWVAIVVGAVLVIMLIIVANEADDLAETIFGG